MIVNCGLHEITFHELKTNWLGQININCDISDQIWAVPSCLWNEKQRRQFFVEKPNRNKS